jgi:hypothetical protein
MIRRADWRHSLAMTEDRYRRDLAAARARGQTTYQIGTGRIFDPTRLSDRKREEIIRAAARATVERSINQHNEKLRG